MPAKISPDLAKGEQCRRSLFKFVQEFWEEIIPEDPVWNWHIEYLCDELQRDLIRLCRLPEQIVGGFKLPPKSREVKLHDLLVNIPPGTSKSTIFTVMGPAWIWTVDPTIRIISASYSGDLAIDHAVKSRDIIQSAKYRRYFPGIEIRADHNNKSNYKNTLGGERYATSTGGTITGIHAHWICCFPYEVKIQTNKGLKSIGDIVENREDLLVLSYNELTKEAEYKPIVKYEKNPFRPLVRIETKSGKELICTEDHLVFTHNRGYVEAINLVENDELEIL